jgi:hypothetical protein
MAAKKTDETCIKCKSWVTDCLAYDAKDEDEEKFENLIKKSLL